MKYIKMFESFEIGLNEKELKIISGYGIKHPEFITKDDGYYSIWDQSCEDPHDIPKMYKRGIKSFCENHDINYVMNPDYTVDVKGNVRLSNKSLKRIPFKFNLVKFFDCSNNNLISLEGSPNITTGGFWCNNNNLTSLKGAPNTILSSFFVNTMN